MTNTVTRQEMNPTKKITTDNQQASIICGKYFITWGFVVSIGIFLECAAKVMQISDLFLIWFWIIAISCGWIYMGSLIWKEWHYSKQKQITNFTNKMLFYIWGACGIGLVLAGFFGSISGVIRHGSVPAIICMLMGIGFFISSAVLNYSWFRWIALIWWSGSTGMLLWANWPGVSKMVIFALLMFLLLFIPGIIIYRIGKKAEKTL